MARHIKCMKCFQTQHQGVATKVRRAMTQEDYEQMRELIWELSDPEIHLCASAYFAFQLYMIGKLDDMTKFQKLDL